MEIWLRTGSNQDMKDVVEVTSGLNGATTTSFVRADDLLFALTLQTWTLPQLNATGPIYFYGAYELRGRKPIAVGLIARSTAVLGMSG